MQRKTTLTVHVDKKKFWATSFVSLARISRRKEIPTKKKN